MADQGEAYSEFLKKARKAKRRYWFLFLMYFPFMVVVISLSLKLTNSDKNVPVFFFAYGALMVYQTWNLYDLICPKCGKKFFDFNILKWRLGPCSNECSCCGLKLK